VQNHVQQGTANLDLAVVINQAQSPKLVHEKADARSRRADDIRERLLADFRQNRFWLAFLAKIRKQQKGPRQPHPVHVRVKGNKALTELPPNAMPFEIELSDVEDILAYARTLIK
jgi:hypothetical protein